MDPPDSRRAGQSRSRRPKNQRAEAQPRYGRRMRAIRSQARSVSDRRGRRVSHAAHIASPTDDFRMAGRNAHDGGNGRARTSAASIRSSISSPREERKDFGTSTVDRSFAASERPVRIGVFTYRRWFISTRTRAQHLEQCARCRQRVLPASHNSRTSSARSHRRARPRPAPSSRPPPAHWHCRSSPVRAAGRPAKASQITLPTPSSTTSTPAPPVISRTRAACRPRARQHGRSRRAHRRHLVAMPYRARSRAVALATHRDLPTPPAAAWTSTVSRK